jgi:hypothetical protein
MMLLVILLLVDCSCLSVTLHSLAAASQARMRDFLYWYRAFLTRK